MGFTFYLVNLDDMVTMGFTILMVKFLDINSLGFTSLVVELLDMSMLGFKLSLVKTYSSNTCWKIVWTRASGNPYASSRSFASFTR